MNIAKKVKIPDKIMTVFFLQKKKKQNNTKENSKHKIRHIRKSINRTRDLSHRSLMRNLDHRDN